jgi:hypothetical protein
MKMYIVDLRRNIGVKQTYLAILATKTIFRDKYHRSYLHEKIQEMLALLSFAQSIPISSRVERNAKRTKFQQVQLHCNFNFIPIVCTSKSNVILMWKDF